MSPSAPRSEATGTYVAYMTTVEFQEGLAELERLARDRRVAVL